MESEDDLDKLLLFSFSFHLELNSSTCRVLHEVRQGKESKKCVNERLNNRDEKLTTGSWQDQILPWRYVSLHDRLCLDVPQNRGIDGVFKIIIPLHAAPSLDFWVLASVAQFALFFLHLAWLPHQMFSALFLFFLALTLCLNTRIFKALNNYYEKQGTFMKSQRSVLCKSGLWNQRNTFCLCLN